MSLPDVSRLASASPNTLRDVGRKLAAIGVTLAAAAPFVAAVQALVPALRKPLRTYHLRRRRDAVGTALRALLFSDPVTVEEARAAFGSMFETMLELGLLERQDDGAIVSPFIVGIVDDLYVLSDDLSRGHEAAMGFGATTIDLCRATFPREPVGRVLDMGCGSGTAALVLSRRAREAIGVDVNPRAVTLARVNAALNGIANATFREGDLFAPVAGEQFDLIVSQPPFIPRPAGVDAAAFLYGGARGDELSLELMTRIGPHMAPGGRAVLVVDWPEYGLETLEHRLRSALGADGPSLLVMSMPTTGLDEHAASYAAGLHPSLDRAFEDEATMRRRHFDDQGITALRPTLVVLERPKSGAPFTDALAIEPRGKSDVTAERIDRLLAARVLLTGRPEALLAAKLRVPEGTVLAQEQVGPGAEVESTLVARFTPEALMAPCALTEDLLLLITCVHETATVRAGLELFAEQTETPFEQALPGLFSVVSRALVQGLLEVRG